MSADLCQLRRIKKRERVSAARLCLHTLLHFLATPAQWDFGAFVLNILQHRDEVSDNLTGVLPPSQLTPLFHKSSLCKFLHLVAKLHCLVATRSSYLHCFVTRPQTLLSSQICAIEHWRWGVSEILSACGKLRLDLCILRCGWAAFNVLMIKRESFWTQSSWVTCTACLGKEKSDPYFCPKLSLLFDSQCTLWFWCHRGRRERKQQAEVFQS